MGVRRSLAAMTVALGLAGVGCSAVRGEPAVDLDGTWVLVSGRTAEGPLDLTPDTHVTLAFDDEGLGGTAPCNDYGADYDLDGDSFEVPGPGIERTLMGCGEEPEALESAYLSALDEVDTVTRDGDTLTLTGEDVELELRLEEPWSRAEVIEHPWRMVSWTDDAGVEHLPEWEPGLEPYLQLDGSNGGGPLTASTGCRELDGRWQMWRGAPAITEAEWSGECPDRLMGQEMVVGNALSEPVLELRGSGDAAELVLRYAHANGPAKVVYRR